MKIDPRSLPSTEDIQKKVFQTFQEKRTPILVIGGLLVVAIVLGIVLLISGRSEEDAIRSQLFEATRSSDIRQVILNLEEAVRDASGSEVEPYALYRLATSCWVGSHSSNVEDADRIDFLDRGLAALSRLELEFPESSWSLAPSPGDRSTTFVRYLRRKMNAEREWLVANAYVHPTVDTEFTALIETNRGNIRLGFFPEQAPNHVANFMKLAKEGFYNDLLVHRVVTAQFIEMGCPNTRDREAMLSHGKGGPGYDQDEERARITVNHRRKVVSTALDRTTGGESGSRFIICVEDVTDLDKTTTPFAEVIEGMDVVDQIATISTFGNDPVYRGSEQLRDLGDHPTQDIVIRTISIQKDGKPVEGHTWDTSIVGSAWKAETEPEEEGEEEAEVPDELKEKLEALMGEAAKLEQDGKLEEALAKLTEVLALDPAHPDAVKKAAELREKLGG
jgi:peptidyl-prolyl cis-trans isomerase B (cyclophilin B)